jgi:hypothetical protein
MPEKKTTPRYGIAELYGQSLAALSAEQVRALSGAAPKTQACPFRGAVCNKNGGVCSFRLYQRNDAKVEPVDDTIVTLCPQRFREAGTIFQWAGRELLGCENPTVLREVPFLLDTTAGSEDAPDAVGQIDMVLVDETQATLPWCALEIQAVYFSGPSMASQFAVLREWIGPDLPFPDKTRRPDFRSSGPKRLMPQLQTKVPTLRRWGRKMAVEVDLPFWQSLGAMDRVASISNCDVAWFVVRYAPTASGFTLVPHALHLTTLERAVEGLTGGVPVSLEAFEQELRTRLSQAAG